MTPAEKKVVYIEDDKYIGAIFKKKLENLGYEVVHVLEGTVASEMIAKETEMADAKVILLDLMLPDTDGFDLLRAIKDSEKLKHIPVIVLSNIDGEEQMKEAMSLGVADYMVKAHYTTDQIAERINQVIHKQEALGDSDKV